MKRRALDLFCGAGGATKGLQRAGFHVTGVDIKRQPRYCGDVFVQADALKPPFDLREFDFIWASPPCQAFTTLRALHGKTYPNHIEATRSLLERSGRPWVMENVPGAPLTRCLVLCGTMFGLRVYRHRVFEVSFFVMQPGHPKHRVKAGGHKSQRQRKKHYEAGGFVTITGNVGSYCGPAMDIDWMTGESLSQAIPPAYSEFIGKQVMRILERAA
jgi:DNA (cytosine-5)-methyltransferase 1